MISDLIRRFGGKAPSINLQEVRQGMRAPYLFFDVDLSVARSLAAGTALVQSVGGTVLFADPKAASGIARIYVIGDLQPVVPVTVYPGSIFLAPFTRLIIENDAQPGLSMRVLYGSDIDFLPGIGGARPMWYDRAPNSTGLQYAVDGVAPHGTTTRWTYTCPSGRKSMVEAGGVHVLRQTAAGTAGLVVAEMQGQYNDATNSRFIHSSILTNGVGDRASQYMGLQTLLMSGEQVLGRTGDASTGGTVNYRVAAKFTEYDA